MSNLTAQLEAAEASNHGITISRLPDSLSPSSSDFIAALNEHLLSALEVKRTEVHRVGSSGRVAKSSGQVAKSSGQAAKSSGQVAKSSGQVARSSNQIYSSPSLKRIIQ